MSPSMAATRGDDIAHIVRRYGITCWLIPSIWPETFPFTTHEAVGRAPNGTVLPLGPGDMSDRILRAVQATYRPRARGARLVGAAR